MTTLAVVGDVNVMVIVPSLPTRVGSLYGQEMHWPPVYLSSVPVNTLLFSGPEERYHYAAPPAR